VFHKEARPTRFTTFLFLQILPLPATPVPVNHSRCLLFAFGNYVSAPLQRAAVGCHSALLHCCRRLQPHFVSRQPHIRVYIRCHSFLLLSEVPLCGNRRTKYWNLRSSFSQPLEPYAPQTGKMPAPPSKHWNLPKKGSDGHGNDLRFKEQTSRLRYNRTAAILAASEPAGRGRYGKRTAGRWPAPYAERTALKRVRTLLNTILKILSV
jgi:hypothetical protein